MSNTANIFVCDIPEHLSALFQRRSLLCRPFCIEPWLVRYGEDLYGSTLTCSDLRKGYWDSFSCTCQKFLETMFRYLLNARSMIESERHAVLLCFCRKQMRYAKFLNNSWRLFTCFCCLSCFWSLGDLCRSDLFKKLSLLTVSELL